MKTIKEIQFKIDELKMIDRTDLNKTEINKIKKKIEYFEQVKRYIETSPSIQYLQSEKDRLMRELKEIDDGQEAFVEKYKHIDRLTAIRWWKKKNNVDKKQKNLFTIDYLLG